MNINKIKEIINNDSLTDSYKRSLILSVIAKDMNALPDLISILQEERIRNWDLIKDSNAELSRALTVLNDDNLTAGKNVICDPKWVVGEIIKHYIKWKDVVMCNFKIEGLE